MMSVLLSLSRAVSRRGFGVLLGGVLLAAACSSSPGPDSGSSSTAEAASTTTVVVLGDGGVLLTLVAEITDDTSTDVFPDVDTPFAIIEESEAETFWEMVYPDDELRDRLVERTMVNLDVPGVHGGVSQAILGAVGARLAVTDGSGVAAIGLVPGDYLVCLLFEARPGATEAEFQISACASVEIVEDTKLRMRYTGEGGVGMRIIEPGS